MYKNLQNDICKRMIFASNISTIIYIVKKVTKSKYTTKYHGYIKINNYTYLRCIRTRVSNASCRRPISWVRLSYSCLRFSMRGSVLTPVGASSSLSVGI